MPDVQALPTKETIRAACEAGYAQLNSALDRLADPLSNAAAEGEWNVRQLLSHQIGVLFRTPIQAAFYSNVPEDGSLPVIPIVIGDLFSLKEWEEAPLASFRNALDVAYFGNLAFIDALDPTELAKVGRTPFGELPLSAVLVGSYRHPIGAHNEQLEAFLT